MALSYQWKWLRGQNLTAKFNMGTTALGETYGPVIISSNLLELPTAGAELLGVVPSSAAASATGVPVIISDDVFEVQVKAEVDLALGDAVAIEADGSVDAAADGESVCGHVVDYDPASGGIAHVKASFGGLRAALGGEEILDILAAETDGAAGADKIGITPVSGVGTANTDTVQEFIEALDAKLKAVTDAAAGADYIGMTAITETGAAATVQSVIEALIARLKAETDSAAGADLVGATPIAETGAANSVQEILEGLVTRLKAVTDAASGADLIGATAIATLGAAVTVQAQLEAVAALIGDLSTLTTTEKGTLVGAINEIDGGA